MALHTTKAPSDLPVRTCGCSFCRKHRPRYTSDPAGSLLIRAGEAELHRYRFGLRLADFLLCARCGVFVAAVEPEAALGVLNLEVLERADELTAVATRFEAYDVEDEVTRRARRARNWTPTQVDLG